MVQSKYPNQKQLKEVLELHGLTDEEYRGISFIDNEDNGRVGFAWRGKKFTKAMQGIEETLQLKGIGVRFSKLEEDRGIVYVEKLKES